jgi:hypothetical protein
MNFQLELKKYDNLYSLHRFYTIGNITNWHKHCDEKGSQREFTFNYYIRLYDTRVTNNLEILPECKCLLTQKQMQMFEYLVNYTTKANVKQ